MKLTITVFSAVVMLSASGCARDQQPVRSPEDITEIDHLRGQVEELEREAVGLRRRISELEAEGTVSGQEIARLRRDVMRYRIELEELRTRLDLSDGEAAELREIAERRAREITALRSLVDRRTEVYDQLRQRLATLISSGRLSIGFRRGFIVLRMPNRILFASGSADVSTEGEETLTAVAEALAEIENRRFLVAGHTDNVPIRLSGWNSNWHLSSARAQSVLNVLIGAGVPPDIMGAAGFGEFDPFESNDTSEGRTQNRRTELLVIPNLEELFRAVRPSNEI